MKGWIEFHMKLRNDCHKRNVAILRTTAIDPEPRVEKTAKWLQKAGFRVTIFGWDREGTSKSKDINDITIERSKFKGKYGDGLG